MTAGVIPRLLLWCLSHTWGLFINALLLIDLLRITLHLDMVQIVLEYMYAYVFVEDLHLYKNFTPLSSQFFEDSQESLWTFWMLNGLGTLQSVRVSVASPLCCIINTKVMITHWVKMMNMVWPVKETDGREPAALLLFSISFFFLILTLFLYNRPCSAEPVTTVTGIFQINKHT